MEKISSKLNEIKTAKDNIKSSIEAKGITVGNAPISEYSSKIDEIVTGGVEKPTQNKEVTPTKEEQIVRADEGYELSQVTVEPIPDNYIEPTGTLEITKNGEYDVTNYASANVSIESVGGESSKEYEFAEFDPINVIDLLDNDTEPYEYKAVVLLLNQGTNSLSISYADNLYNSGDIIRFSDGGEITVSGTQTYIFDESKDFVNSLGQKVRYFIVYKKTNPITGNYPSYNSDILMWYFKNCIITETGLDYIKQNGVAKTMVFDDNCTHKIMSQNIGSNSATVEKYIAPSQTTVQYKSLTNAFGSCSNLKEAKLNLNNEVTSMQEAFYYDYSLRNIHLINCPNETVNCANFISSCYSLENLIAQPILIPTNQSGFFNNLYSLKKVSGIDFANFTSAQTLTYCKNLAEIDNVANISVNFNVSNCTQLSHQSLINLFNALVDLTGQTAKTLTIGTTNLLKVTDEEKAIVASKNWNLS